MRECSCARFSLRVWIQTNRMVRAPRNLTARQSPIDVSRFGRNLVQGLFIIEDPDLHDFLYVFIIVLGNEVAV